MKIKLLSLLIIFTGLSFLCAQDGYEILKRVDEKPEPKTTHALIRMILTDHRGEQNERLLEQWSAVDKEGNTHSVMVFHSPSSVKNTRFLSKENKDRDDDQWIFLPALNRVRRIATSDDSGNFMGSEFSYYDMKSRELENYSYKYIGKETIGAYECYIVETRPNPEADSPYAKTISWVTVDKNINTVMKIELYESETELLKVMTVEDISEISGYWVPINLIMTNVQNNRSTTLEQQKLILDKAVNTTRFSQRFLETGKTQ